MAASSSAAVGSKRKKTAYKGSEEEFDFNCDVLDKLYAEVELNRNPNGSNSFSSLTSTNTSATAAAAGASPTAQAKAKEEKLARSAALAAAAGVDVKAKAPLPGEGLRFVAALRRSPPTASRLVLTVSDGGDHVWSAALAYAEFCEHRDKLDVGEGVGWKELFGYAKAAFERRGQLHIDLTNWAAPTLAVSYRIGEHIDLIGRFTLRQVTDVKLKAAEQTGIVFALLERAKVSAMALHTADELRRAKGELQLLHTRLTSLATELATANATNAELTARVAQLSQIGAGHAYGGGAGLDGDDAAGSGAGAGAGAAASQALGDMPPPASIVVKQKHMSVVNPRIKRRKKRGVKIGEGDD